MQVQEAGEVTSGHLPTPKRHKRRSVGNAAYMRMRSCALRPTNQTSCWSRASTNLLDEQNLLLSRTLLMEPEPVGTNEQREHSWWLSGESQCISNDSEELLCVHTHYTRSSSGSQLKTNRILGKGNIAALYMGNLEIKGSFSNRDVNLFPPMSSKFRLNIAAAALLAVNSLLTLSPRHKFSEFVWMVLGADLGEGRWRYPPIVGKCACDK